MKSQNNLLLDPDMQGVEAALKRAAKNALELGRRTNTPVYVYKNGKIIDLVTGKEKKQVGD